MAGSADEGTAAPKGAPKAAVPREPRHAAGPSPTAGRSPSPSSTLAASAALKGGVRVGVSNSPEGWNPAG